VLVSHFHFCWPMNQVEENMAGAVDIWYVDMWLQRFTCYNVSLNIRYCAQSKALFDGYHCGGSTYLIHYLVHCHERQLNSCYFNETRLLSFNLFGSLYYIVLNNVILVWLMVYDFCTGYFGKFIKNKLQDSVSPVLLKVYYMFVKNRSLI